MYKYVNKHSVIVSLFFLLPSLARLAIFLKLDSNNTSIGASDSSLGTIQLQFPPKKKLAAFAAGNMYRW